MTSKAGASSTKPTPTAFTTRTTNTPIILPPATLITRKSTSSQPRYTPPTTTTRRTSSTPPTTQAERPTRAVTVRPPPSPTSPLFEDTTQQLDPTPTPALPTLEQTSTQASSSISSAIITVSPDSEDGRTGSDSSKSGGLSGEVIAGIVVGGISLALLSWLLWYCGCCRSKDDRSDVYDDEERKISKNKRKANIVHVNGNGNGGRGTTNIKINKVNHLNLNIYARGGSGDYSAPNRPDSPVASPGSRASNPPDYWKMLERKVKAAGAAYSATGDSVTVVADDVGEMPTFPNKIGKKNKKKKRGSDTEGSSISSGSGSRQTRGSAPPKRVSARRP
ncbi:hypothetical protein QBC44DRAFT_398442 [Cladorrhinum sp. PSN332]|nr:hypothetical protein QBC44DRAFT_398442 [Cladorrhinum sp. PSN332]